MHERSIRKTGTRGSRGQSTVEFALVLPAVVLVLIAIIQVAISLNCYLAISNASRQGARSASSSNDIETGRRTALKATSGLPGDSASVDVEFPKGRSKGSPVKVTVTYKMPLVFPGIEKLIPQPTFKRSTTMALERGQQ
ncbi:MAG: pilus assembly protein [Actinobacteria bacterium]|nr:pilus assembly protein [Actinomycetota bacterium]